MAGQKQIGWHKLVAGAVFVAGFVVVSFLFNTPQASAAASYAWKDTATITASGYDSTGTGLQPTFDLACTGSFGSLSCTSSGNATCTQTIAVTTDTTTGTLTPSGGGAFLRGAMIGCKTGATQSIKIGGTGPTASSGGGGANNGSVADTELQCDPAVSSSIGWALCPIVHGINAGVGQLDNAITSLLTVDATKTFDTRTATGNGYYQAWQAFRGFALAFLFLAGLVMVISQAMGFEILDAYTVKKVLPRLVMAIIGIALSWEIMKFFVSLTNDLGDGIRAIIYYPFNKASLPGHLYLGGGQAFAISLITTSAVFALTAVGLLSFALTAALAVGVAFLVLIVRQLIVIVLILFAPIAIACSILPNTQSVYKLWFESFTKAMLMFPIIVAFLAIGRVFAVTSAGADIAHVAAINQLIAFAAYFLPYFLIPLTFSLAGGAMRTIGGKFNDSGRGGFDRLKKFRGNKAAEAANKSKNFSRFSEKSKIGRGLNNAAGIVSNPGSLLHGRAGVAARRASLQGAYGAGAAKSSAVWQENAQDDNFLMAMADPEIAKQKLGDAEADVKASKLVMDNNAPTSEKYLAAEKTNKAKQAEVFARKNGINNANQIPMGIRNTRAAKISAAKGLAQTGYQLDYGTEGYEQLDHMVRGIYGNDEEGRAGAMNELQYNLKSAGRYDLGGINNGAGHDFELGMDKSGGYTSGNAKTQTFYGGMEHFLGVKDTKADSNALATQINDVRLSSTGASRETYDEGLVKWHSRLLDAEQSPTFGNKKEVIRQREAIENMLKINPSTDPADTALSDKLKQNRERSRVQMDPATRENNTP